MTDRVHALTVILERDTRDDDVKELVSAISMLRNVAEVKTGIVTGADLLARSRAQAELRKRLMELAGVGDDA